MVEERHGMLGGGPDIYGILDFNKVLVKKDLEEVTLEGTTARECIAELIRQLTYRELKQIADEILKCAVGDELGTDAAQTLDNWAHMVKEEDECISGMRHDTCGNE